MKQRKCTRQCWEAKHGKECSCVCGGKFHGVALTQGLLPFTPDSPRNGAERRGEALKVKQ